MGGRNFFRGPTPTQDAKDRHLPICPKCSAAPGLPCRKPKGHVIKAHLDREDLWNQLLWKDGV